MRYPHFTGLIAKHISSIVLLAALVLAGISSVLLQ